MKRLSYFLLLLFLVPVGVALTRHNLSPVQVDLYFTTVTLPLALLLTLALTCGIVLSLFAGALWYWRHRTHLHRLRRELRMCRAEIKNLREIPIKDNH
jgi:putative membrane protein